MQEEPGNSSNGIKRNLTEISILLLIALMNKEIALHLKHKDTRLMPCTQV